MLSNTSTQLVKITEENILHFARKTLENLKLEIDN